MILLAKEDSQYVPYQNERMKHIHSVDPLRCSFERGYKKLGI